MKNFGVFCGQFDILLRETTEDRVETVCEFDSLTILTGERGDSISKKIERTRLVEEVVFCETIPREEKKFR